MSTHYTANVKVEKVTKTAGNVGQQLQGTGSREVSEALHITVRADTLRGLKAKVAAHVNLLDEEDVS